MAIVTIQPEPRFLLRPGPNDHKLLESVLTPGMLHQPARFDGVILEAPHRRYFLEARGRLDKSTSVFVDPQAYRLQADSVAAHSRLTKLSYSPLERGLKWEDFRDEQFVTKFVMDVLDAQNELSPTHYCAPSFYVPSLDSPWRAVNERLLRVTLGMTGGRVYATICGSYSALCKTEDARIAIGSAITADVDGVFVSISPFSAYSATPAKLANYLSLLKQLSSNHVAVYATHQPAFGLGCMAAGLAGFDSGVGIAETFDYARLVRPPRKSNTSGKKAGRPKSFYVEQLATHLPAATVSEMAAGSFESVLNCSRPCCQFSRSNGIALRGREHFIHTRLDEVTRLRRLPNDWRLEEFREGILKARRLADRVLRDVPTLSPMRFRHLDTWDKCFTEVSGLSAKGVGS